MIYSMKFQDPSQLHQSSAYLLLRSEGHKAHALAAAVRVPQGLETLDVAGLGRRLKLEKKNDVAWPCFTCNALFLGGGKCVYMFLLNEIEHRLTSQLYVLLIFFCLF